MNEGLLDILNGGIVGRWDFVDDQVLFWARYGVFLLAAAAGVLGLRDLKRSPSRGMSLAAFVLAASIVALGLLWVAGHLFSEAQPFVQDRDTVQLLPHSPDNSFPSDYATLAALVAVVAALAWPRHAWWLLALGLAVGLARVMAGVHYPGDVLAGWIIGGGTAVLLWQVVQLATGAPTRRFTLRLRG